MTMTRTLACALALGAALAGAARADDSEAERTRFRVQVRTQIEQKLAAAAGLDPATAARMAAVVDRSDDQKAALQRDNQTAYLELKHLLEMPQPDAAAINRLIDHMLANRSAILRNEEERTREVRRLMAPAQYARIMIAWPMVNKQIRAGIRKALMEHANAVDDALGE